MVVEVALETGVGFLSRVHTLSVFRFGTRVLSFFPVASNSFFRLSRKALVFSCSFGFVFIKLFDAMRSFVKHDILEFVRSFQRSNGVFFFVRYLDYNKVFIYFLFFGYFLFLHFYYCV